MKRFIARLSSKLFRTPYTKPLMGLPRINQPTTGLKDLSRLQIYLGLCVILCVGTILAMVQFITYYDTSNNDPSAVIQDVLEHGLVYSGGVIKDERDTKHYATLVLPNNLRVLAISQPGTQVSGVGIDVAAGSLLDPPHAQGLAHLLEHMVFMGSKEYPQENEFEHFLGENNGHSNAYTSQENTNYYYKVSCNALDKSLERMASLLRAPLLANESMGRELHAIQNEFLKDSLEDTRRTWRLFKHLSDPCHPFHRLSPGNLETLSPSGTLNALKLFHQTYYTAERMKVVIYGKESTQALLDMAKRHLSGFTSKPLPPDQESCLPYPHLGKWVSYTPLRSGHTLDLLFPVTDNARCGVGVVAKILSIKHESSAASALKKRGWAILVSSSVYATTSQFSVLRVNVKLTSLGATNRWKVVKIIFDYIHALQSQDVNLLRRQIEALHADNLQGFKSQDQIQVHHFVKQLSHRMNLVLHPMYYLGAPLHASSTSCVQVTLQALTPYNALLMYGSSADTGVDYEIEPWYKVPYYKTNITTKQHNYILSPKYLVGVAPPKVSRKIPQQLSLYPRDESQTAWPAQIHKNNGLTLWWQQDYLFDLPRVDLVAWVYQSKEYVSAAETAHAVLLVTLIQDQLSDLMLEYGTSVNVHYQSSSGFIVQMHGYSGSFVKTVGQVFSVIAQLDLTQVDRFNWVVKYEAGRKLTSTEYAEAYKHPLFDSRVVLEEHIYPLQEVREEIEKATLKSLLNFYTSLKADLGVRCVLYGNLLKVHAQEYVQAILPVLRDTKNQFIDPPFHPTLQYAPGTYLKTSSYPNLDEKASVADVSFILGPTPWNGDKLHSSEALYTRALLARITATILQEPLFSELRSKQQLGYSVFSKYVPHFGIDYIHLCVQGTEHSSVVMVNAIFNFLKQFRDVVEDFDIDHLNLIINSVKQDILSRPSNPLNKILLLVNELFSPDPQYNRQELYLLALERVDKDKLLHFYDTYILGDSSRKFILLSDSALSGSYNDISVPNVISLNSTQNVSLQPFLYWRFTHLGISL